jgi:hypothetical protein
VLPAWRPGAPAREGGRGLKGRPKEEERWGGKEGGKRKKEKREREKGKKEKRNRKREGK